MSGPEFNPNLADFSGIVEAYRLAQSFEKNMDAVYGKDDALVGKVTDLFFVRTGHGLEFLKKYSWKAQLFRHRDKEDHGGVAFDVRANIESAAKLFDKVFFEMNSLQSEAELDRLAEQLGVQSKRAEKVTWKLGKDGKPIKDEEGNFIRIVEPGRELSRGEVLRQSLVKVVEHLNQLKYRVGTSWAEQAVTVEDLQIEQQLTKANQLVGKIFATATDEELLQSKALSELKKSLTSKNGTPRLLELTSHRLEMNKALFKELFTNSAHELVGELKKVLDDVERLEAQNIRSELHLRIKVLKEIKISAIPQRVQTTFLEAIPEELKPSIKLKEKGIQQQKMGNTGPSNKAKALVIPEVKGKEIPASRIAALQIPRTEPKSIDEQDFLQEIDRPNRPFSEQIYNALVYLVKANPHSETYLYACDLFFKKLATLNAAEKLTASREFMELFQQLSSSIVSVIDPNSIEASQSKVYGMVLIANHSVELLFQQWAKDSGFTADFIPSIASTEVYEQIKMVQTADPFWIERFAEMRKLHESLLPGQNKNVDSLFPIQFSSGNSEKIDLNDQVVRAMIDWTRGNSATAKKITESIKADRVNQEKSIREKEGEALKKALEFERTYDECTAEIKNLEQEIQNIGNSLQVLVDPKEVIYNKFASIEPIGSKLKSSWNRFEPILKQKIASLNVQNFDSTAVVEIQDLITSYCPPENPNDLPVHYLDEQLCDAISSELEKYPRYQESKAALEKTQSELTKALNIVKQNASQADKNMRTWAYRYVRGARVEVCRDSQYWPWGIAEGDVHDPATAVTYKMRSGQLLTWDRNQMRGEWKPVPERWSERQLAEYYFSNPQFVITTKAIGDIIPHEFRELFFNSVVSSKNLFHKQGAGPIPSVAITHDSLSANQNVHTLGPGCITLKAAAVKGFTQAVSRLDLYLQSLGSKHSDLYKNAFKPMSGYEELAIPKWVAEGIRHPIEEVLGGGKGIAAKVFEGVMDGIWNVAGWAKQKISGNSEQEVLLDDELRELTQLSSDDAIRIDNTIAYFEENPRALRERDGRLLFHALIFKDNLLLRALQDPQANELLLPRLNTLFSRAITGASNSKDYVSAADICWLAASVQHSINHLNAKKIILKDVIDNQQLFGVLQACADPKYTQDREILYEPLVAACGLLMRGRAVDGQEELVAYGLLANVMKNLQETHQEQKIKSLPQRHDAQEAIVLLRDMLSKMEGQPKFATQLTQVGRKVLGAVHDSLALVAFKNGSNGVFLSTDSSTWLSLTEGRLENQSVFQQQADLLDRATANILVKSGLYAEADLRPLRGYTVDGVVHIADKKSGLELQVDKQNQDIFVRIHLKQNGVDHFVWANYLTNKITIGNQELREELHQLRGRDGKVYFCDTQTLKPRYETKGPYVVQCGGNLVLSSCPPDFPTSHFEEPDVSRYWCDKSGDLQRVELPRFKLAFEKNKNGRFEHDAGWCLAGDQSIAGFDQKSDGYLVLEKEGKKKLFLPAKDPLSGKATGRYLEYAVSVETGKLVPQTTESRYYLANLHFKKGNPGEVEKLLYVRIAEETSRKLTSNEEEQLRSLFMHADKSSRGCCLRMQALYLLERNKGQFVKEVLKEDERKPFSEEALHAELQLVNDGVQFVAGYLKQEGHLEPEKELFVLRRLQKHVGEIEFEALRSFRQSIPRQLSSGIKEMKSATDFKRRIEELEKAIRIKETAALEIEEKRKQGLYDSEALVPLLERAPSEQMAHYLKFFEKVGEDAGRSLSLLRRQYFDEKAEPLKVAEFPDLFSLKSPQAVAKRSQEKYSQTTADIEVAQRQELRVIATSPDDVITPGTTLYTAFAELAPKMKVVVKEGQESALQESLIGQIEKEEKLLAQEGQLIVAIVKAVLNADPVAKTLLDTNMKSYPTIEELSLLCCRKDYISFAAKYYPELGATGMDFLQVAVKKYLLQKCHVQQLHRTHNDLEAVIAIQNQIQTNLKDKKEVVGLSQELEALQERLRTTIDSTRAYPADHKLAMIFLFLETTLDITLRSEQVMNILKFDESIPEGDKKGRAKVLQMIMGAGKTSIIQPVLSILFARADSLSTIMVPEAQFQSVRKLLSKTLGDTYDKCLYSVPYDLELSRNGEYLDELLLNLNEAKKRGACLLMPPRVKYSIVTSLYSAYYDCVHSSPEDQTAAGIRVDRIAKICKFMEENELLQIDEYDMIMNPNVVFTSPIGESDKYDEQAGYARPAIITELIFHLIEMGDKIREEVSIDFVNVYLTAQGRAVGKLRPDVPDLDARLYRTKIKPLLVEKACEILAKRGGNFKILDEEGYLKPFLSGELLSDSHETIMKKRIAELVTTPEDQDFLVASWESINEVLSSSLPKKVGEHYGQDVDGKYIARPYEALKQKPTVYSEPLEKIAHTIALYMNKGVPLEDAKEILLSWQEKIKRETIDLGKEAAETEFGARLIKVMSVVPGAAAREFFLDEESPTYEREFEALAALFQKAISKDKATFVEFIKEKVYTNVTVNLKSATCTPQTLAGSGKIACGYAGTYNGGLLAPFMEGIPEVGTDAKTILAVERKILNGTADVSVCPGEEKELPERILEQFRSGITVVIDTGSWLKQKKIEDFVKEDLFCKPVGIRRDRPEIEGVVYINEKGEKVCWDDVEQRTLPFELSRLYLLPEKRLTIIPSAYVTGTDITQTPTARAFMTVSVQIPPMTIRDALQSKFRMRQILGGQSVSSGLTEEAKRHISNSIVDGLLLCEKFTMFFEDNTALAQEAFTEMLASLQADGIELTKPMDLKKLLQEALVSYNADEGVKKGLLSKEERIVLFQSCFAKLFNPDSKALSFFMWGYFAVNQAKLEAQQESEGAVHSMKELTQKPIRSLLADTSAPRDQRIKLFESTEGLFIQTESKSEKFKKLLQLPGQKRDEGMEQAARHLQYLTQSKSSSLYGQISRFIVERYGTQEEKTKGAAAEKILETRLTEYAHKIASQTSEVRMREVEAEKEKEAERERLVEKEKERVRVQEVEVALAQPPSPKDVEKYPYKPLYGQTVPRADEGYDIARLIDAMLSSKRAIANVLPKDMKIPELENVYYSENLIREDQPLTEQKQASQYLPARYVLCCSDGKNKRYILLSHADYVLVKSGLRHAENLGNKTAVVYTLQGSVAAKPRGRAVEQDEVLLRRTLVAVKFCMARRGFDPTEIETLMEVISSSGGNKLGAVCRKYYKDRLKYLPKTSKEFYKGRGNELAQRLAGLVMR